MIGEILKQSFKITWRHPSLWFWGFLASLLIFSANELVFILVFPSFFLNFNYFESLYFLENTSTPNTVLLSLLIFSANELDWAFLFLVSLIITLCLRFYY